MFISFELIPARAGEPASGASIPARRGAIHLLFQQQVIANGRHFATKFGHERTARNQGQKVGPVFLPFMACVSTSESNCFVDLDVMLARSKRPSRGVRPRISNSPPSDLKISDLVTISV